MRACLPFAKNRCIGLVFAPLGGLVFALSGSLIFALSGGLVFALSGSWAMAADIGLPEINRALATMPSQSGQFEQTLPDGTRIGGSYLIDWPDHLRFAYTGATPRDTGAIVTVQDNFVAVQDTPQTEPNWFLVSMTPLAVIRLAVREGISADMVAALRFHDGSVELGLRDPTGKTPGRATLYFTTPELVLYAWRVVDIQNTVTQVRLVNITVRDDLKAADFAIAYDEITEE